MGGKITPPWKISPRIRAQNAKRARLKRKGLTPTSKDELRALAEQLVHKHRQQSTLIAERLDTCIKTSE